MTNDVDELTECVQRHLSIHFESGKAVGLGVGAVAAGAQAMAFGGKRSAEQAAPDQNTVFEIGSITKVFTTTLLADMHLAGEVKLDDPVNQFLPAQGQLVCRGGHDVTLRHLATHTSGLPRMPANLTRKQLLSDNPYADYSADDLYACLAKCRLKSRPGANSSYSNLGSGLLGLVLSLVGGGDYESLVLDRILRPLGMMDTAIRLTDQQQQRLAPGHAKGERVHNWDFQALAAAGAFRSTLADMQKFLRANIDPASTPLSPTIELTHELQTKHMWKWYGDIGCIGPILLVSLGGVLAWRSFGLPLWLRIAIPIAAPAAMLMFLLRGIIPSLDDMALGWHFDRLDHDDGDAHQWALWHNGGTGGYASYIAFSREHRTGVILLANSDYAPDPTGRKLLLDLLESVASTNGVSAARV
ncbi:MAG: serine hydrolase [Planctomycetota bacterium]|nr:serine hydrolase [Planctomycetota bacterium]